MKKKGLTLLLAMIVGLTPVGCSSLKVPAEADVQTVQEAEGREQNVGEEGKDKAAGAENGSDTEETLTGSEEIRFTVVQNIIETEQYVVPEEGESFPYAYVGYPTFVIPDEVRKACPVLGECLEDVSGAFYEHAVGTLAEAAELAQEGEDAWLVTSNQETWELEVFRADACAVGWLLQIEQYYNGPHPNRYYETCMIDTVTGERLSAEDVVNDTDGLPGSILENLEPLDEDYIFSREENEQMLSKIEAMVRDDSLAWTLDQEGFHVYFDAYALQYYAFGPIFADLSFEDYPDLIREEYLPKATKTPLRERISYEQGETVSWTEEALVGYLNNTEPEGAGDDAGIYVIECPDWEVPYVADGIFDTLTASPVNLTEVSRKSSDWLFAEDWSANTGITLPGDLYGTGYSDDLYYYKADNSAEEGRLAVEICEMGSYDAVGTYDFSQYLNTPMPGNEYTTLEIPYARIYDGILYAEIAHRTYSADQPCTGFLTAVEIETGKLLWRSEMLLANSRNFVVGEDTIICGYGFTEEDDYLYILSRHSGAVLEKRKLRTAPDYFIPMGDALYVLTYDTAYEYKISDD